MKKLIIPFFLFITLSCGRAEIIDPLGSNSCEKASEKYLADIEAWTNDITNQKKCEAVKSSLTNLIKSCPTYTAIQRKAYEDELKNFTCN